MSTQKRIAGFSLIELLIVVAIILTIAAIAIPGLLRSRISADNSAAVAVLRNLHNAQATYSATYGSSVGFANDLAKLGPGSPCDQTHACMADELIGCATQPCKKSGYEFYLTSTQTTEPFLDYASTGTPIGWEKSGNRNLCTAQDGVVRQQSAASKSLTAAVSVDVCMNSGTYVPIQ